jgi:2-polyprenyl-3-methyl-5-hydroxy-6-metoxy-1,4-benzoquinol methylase
MTANVIGDIYEKHHSLRNREGFTILEETRGLLFGRKVGTGKKVLDIGCRDGTLTKYFVSGNEVTGVDIDESLLKKAKDNLGIETISFDLNGNWSVLEGRKFDAVVAGEILEHLYYPDTVVEKVAAILSPGGIFVGSVPNAFNLKNRLRYLMGRKKHTPLADSTHINHFHARELKEMLQKYFTDVEVAGLGRNMKLAEKNPGLFAYDLIFKGTL